MRVIRFVLVQHQFVDLMLLIEFFLEIFYFHLHFMSHITDILHNV